MRDQIYLGAQLITIQKISKLPRVLVGIVDAIKHHVFECKSLARFQRLLEVFAGRQKFLQRPFLINRHQLVAQFIGRRRQRDSEMWPLGNCRQFANARHDARCRNRDAVGHNVQAARFRHDTNRFHQSLEIEEGFAGAHAHQVRAPRRSHADTVRIVQGNSDLFDDLARRQVSQQTKLRSQTERALQGATRL